MTITEISNTVPTPGHVPPELIVDFDIYAPCAPNDDFYEAWTSFQASAPGPLVWSPYHGGHWIVTTGDDILQIFKDHENYSSHCVAVPRAADPQPPFGAITQDPPLHGDFRRYLTQGLSPRTVRRREPQIRALAVELIEAFMNDGRCDFISQFSSVLPLSIFLHLVDLPQTDREMLAKWSNDHVAGSDLRRRARAARNLSDYLTPILEARYVADGDDLLTSLVHSHIAGREITIREAAGAAIHLVIAGLDTVASLLGHAFRYLAQDHDLQKRLAEDPLLIPSVTSEFLRRFPVVTMSREIRNDATVHGVCLKRNEMISLPTMLYNWDENIYPDPKSVRLDRPVKENCTFGAGVHRCPGAILGRSEIMITLQEWFARIPAFRLRDESDRAVVHGVVNAVRQLDLVWSV